MNYVPKTLRSFGEILAIISLSPSLEGAYNRFQISLIVICKIADLFILLGKKAALSLSQGSIIHEIAMTVVKINLLLDPSSIQSHLLLLCKFKNRGQE